MQFMKEEHWGNKCEEYRSVSLARGITTLPVTPITAGDTTHKCDPCFDARSFTTTKGKVVHYNANTTIIGTNLAHLKEQSTE